MAEITHNLRLNVPAFDQMPWDVDVNTNWLILDATVGMFAAIPNLVGSWKNATTYGYGMSVIDPADSGIWQCIQGHVSTAAPQSFLQERIQYPGRWVQTTQGAQFYAQQAAASASAAAASAAEAAAAAGAGANALLKTGGTMTGYIVLHADPVSALQAATRQYVDARVGGSGFLPLTGGTLTGALYAGSTGIGYMNVVAADRHLFSFGWNGTAYLAVNGTYIGIIATREFLNGAYLPLTGGSLSGSLYVAGEVTANAIYRIGLSGAYFYSNANATTIQMDSGGWNFTYNRSTGSLTYYRGGDALNLWYVDGSGNGFNRGGYNAIGNIVSSSNLYARGGTLFVGAGDRASFVSDNASYTDLRFLDSYRFQLAWGTGNLHWMRWDSTILMTLDTGGTVHFLGDVNAGNNARVANTVSCVGGSMWFGTGGDGRIWNMAQDWFWEWSGGSGNLYWHYPGGIHFSIRQSDGAQVGNDRAGMYGYGVYANLSDERMKTDIVPSVYGLDDIMKLEPIAFRRIKAAHDREEVGFSAQQVQKVIPHAVHEVYEESHTLGVALDPIVVALVNGMKQLAQRIEQLESK